MKHAIRGPKSKLQTKTIKIKSWHMLIQSAPDQLNVSKFTNNSSLNLKTKVTFKMFV